MLVVELNASGERMHFKASIRSLEPRIVGNRTNSAPTRVRATGNRSLSPQANLPCLRGSPIHHLAKQSEGEIDPDLSRSCRRRRAATRWRTGAAEAAAAASGRAPPRPPGPARGPSDQPGIWGRLDLAGSGGAAGAATTRGAARVCVICFYEWFFARPAVVVGAAMVRLLLLALLFLPRGDGEQARPGGGNVRVTCVFSCCLVISLRLHGTFKLRA
jgi:hypothetical protein